MGYEEFVGYVNDRYDLGENEWMLFCNILEYVKVNASSYIEEYTMLEALLLGAYGLTIDDLKNVRLT